MKINIIIPCYNEEKFIETTVNKIQKNIDPKNDKIIMVDDFSSDNTYNKIIDLKKKFENIVHIKNPKNSGKGSCIKNALDLVDDCDIVIIQDADLEYDPADYKKLIHPFKEYNADIVFGSRYKSDNVRKVSYYWHTVANNLLTFLVNILNNTNLTDMETGYKLFKKNVIKEIDLKERRFGFEPEITIKSIQKKYSIYEVGISYNPRGYKDGKKIKLIDAILAVYCIFKYTFIKFFK